MNPPIEIDGSLGEGGGQVLRTAVTLSALTGKPVRVSGIRAGRSRPGLAAQHLTCVGALARVCSAAVTGDKIGSEELEFTPATRPTPGEYTFDVTEFAQKKSAGSVTLVLQALLLPLALAPGPSRLALLGGTHVEWSPPFDFVTGVYLPALARMGVSATASLVSWGFYPKGGGKISVEVEPVGSLTPLEIPERGELKLVHGRAVACNLKSHIAVRMINRARNMITPLGVPCQIEPERVKGQSAGAVLFLHAEYEHITVGFSALGEPRKPSEKVAEEACEQLFAHDQTGAPITPQLADQLLLPAAVARGRSEFRTSRITSHLVTNAEVIRMFLPVDISIEGNEGEPGTVSVGGGGI